MLAAASRFCERRQYGKNGTVAPHTSRAALLGMDTLFPSLPNLQDKMMISQTSTHRELEALKQTCSQEYPKNAMHVQEAVGSRSSAIHNDYRTSPRPSYVFGPKYLPLKLCFPISQFTVWLQRILP